MLEWIGWVATALFAASYLCKQANALRCLQALAAVLWISYGVIIHAAPIIVANVIVAVMATASVLLQQRRKTEEPYEDTPVTVVVG